MTKRVIHLAIVLIAILAISGCGADRVQRPAPELVVPLIAQVRFDTATVTRGDVSEIAQRTGIVRLESQPLNFGPVSASFDRFLVVPGEEVTYGQLLARLNTDNIERQIARQEERIAEMRTRFDFDNELRRINWQLERLAAGTAAHNLELELAIERQNLQLRHAEEDLETLRARYAQAELRAPFAGTVVFTADRGQGSWVPSFTTVLYIARADAPVYVEYIDIAPLPPPPIVLVHAYIGDRVYNATRIRLTREQQARYRTPPLRFALEVEEGNYPPVGSYVSLQIFTRHSADVLRLPRNAVFFAHDIGYYVHLLSNGQLDTAFVTVGAQTSTYFEIVSGVAEGDEVYVRSHGIVRPPVDVRRPG